MLAITGALAYGQSPPKKGKYYSIVFYDWWNASRWRRRWPNPAGDNSAGLALFVLGVRILGMPFEQGQEVFIKNAPKGLIGTIIERRPGDAHLPEEQAHYEVRIEDERYYRSTDLEAIPEPEPKLRLYSEEWMAELHRMVEAGQRFAANTNDLGARDQFVEAGSRLGWVVPMTDADHARGK